jgi:predicted chitinase
MGRLGSLRQANVNFKVWNINQLNVIEALYFRLGYSMLLEWGHTQYFKNNGEFVRNAAYGINNPFTSNLDKETIQQVIAEKQQKENGNYGGLLGIVSNFNWSFNQEGGYDCTVKVIGLGATIDSTRTNQIYKLPQGLAKEYKNYKNALQKLRDEAAARIAALAAAQNPTASKSEEDPLSPRPTNVSELLAIAKKYDRATDINSSIFYKGSINGGLAPAYSNPSPDYYYVPKGYENTPDYVTKLKNQYEGLYRIYDPGSTAFNSFIKNGDSVSVDITALEGQALAAINRIPNLNSFAGTARTSLGVIFNEGTREFTNQTLDAKAKASRLIDFFYSDGENRQLRGFVRGSVSTPAGPRGFYFRIRYEIVSPNPDFYYLTRKEASQALDYWASVPDPNISTRFETKQQTISDVTFDTETQTGGTVLVTKGIATVKVLGIPFRGDPNSTEAGKSQDVEIKFTFETNDTGLLQPSSTSPVDRLLGRKPATNTVETANSGDNNAAQNESATGQEDSTEGLESALQAMLVIVRSRAWAYAKIFDATDTSTYLSAIDITGLTEKFYNDGALNGVLTSTTQTIRRKAITTVTETPVKVAGPDGLPFDLVQYALKGFNSQLMVDKKKFNDTPKVDFKSLCKAFLVRYPRIDTAGGVDMLASPVYIPFGYLLAFLNNMCILYNSPVPSDRAGQAGPGQKRPFVYIDFNTETNFCLSNEQHLSIDPDVCLIPFNCTDSGYKSIFPDNVALTRIFKPQSENVVTSLLTKEKYSFQTTVVDRASGLPSPYQGKTMNILLNIDYLLNISRDYISSDPEHSLNLQPFLERILVDVNKALGNINLFRLAYRDDTNTVQILDDQWVPNYAGEPSIMTVNAAMSSLRDPKTSGQLPLFTRATNSAPGEVPVGGLSLLRDFQFKTTMNTKLASMIAISAQATTSSINAKDHSSLSWMNRNYKDRYIPYKQDPSNGESGTDTNTKNSGEQVSNDQKAAEMFNTAVATIYSGVDAFTPANTQQAKNYYIERMAKVKSGDTITSAAPFIPANLEFTVDGISGILMGNAFTVPNNRLPLSLRGENGTTKVGFIVTGLTHNIESNTWTTKVVGQMIKLRPDISIFKKPPTRAEAQARAEVPSLANGTFNFLSGACTRQASDAIQNASAGIQILKQAAVAGGLTSRYAIASLLAIAGGESNWNGASEEGFNYPESRLRQVFTGLTEDQISRALAATTRQDFFKIVYGEYLPNRIGNRNVEDGGKYYGRGYIQLTGYGNYKKYGDLIGVDLVNNPNLAADPATAAKIAVAYLKDRVKVDQNSVNYVNAAIPAVGNSVDPQRKADYYNCLVNQV